MRRLLAIVLVLLAAAPIGAVLDAGTALAADSGPALVPAAVDGSAAVRAGSLDASDRWIVVLRRGSSNDAAGARARGLGIRQDHVFNGTFRGYSARLANAQLAQLRQDPGVETVVPDDLLSVQGQAIPTGVSRVFGGANPIAQIDGHDTRVDADVAIVDTGIDPHHVDLNVAGGISCSTSSPTAWADPNGHGTHVAGIVGALDNSYGVVGVAPGVRLWSVRVLDSMGNGLLSWYVCGLDWIAAQRDPTDPTRPLFEAVNMSVAKPGHDDGNCGYTNSDVMHRAVCRVVAAGIPVVAAAGNYSQSAASWIPAAYNEVITVSALADTDGKPGGLGGNACYSWNSYDKDDTFADFSDYGADVDLIAPGKCILSTLPGNRYGVMSGTSMATPLVAGAAALYKSTRPLATPDQVKQALRSMGNLNWNTATDPDPYHEPLLDVSWIVNAGDFAVRYVAGTQYVRPGATLSVPVDVARAEDLALPIDLTADGGPSLAAVLSAPHLEPAGPGHETVTVTVPDATPAGPYMVTVTASDGARQRSAAVPVVVDATLPVAAPPVLAATPRSILGSSSFAGTASWAAATDIGGVTRYEMQWRLNSGSWGSSIALSPATRASARRYVLGYTYTLRLRARDTAGNWSAWAVSRPMGSALVQDTSRSIVRTGRWVTLRTASASGGTITYSPQSGAAYTLRFTGRGVAIVGPLGIRRGRFAVWIDGIRVATVDELASSYHAQRLLYATSALPSRTHTLRVMALYSPGRQRVDLDALLVLR